MSIWKGGANINIRHSLFEADVLCGVQTNSTMKAWTSYSCIPTLLDSFVLAVMLPGVFISSHNYFSVFFPLVQMYLTLMQVYVKCRHSVTRPKFFSLFFLFFKKKSWQVACCHIIKNGQRGRRPANCPRMNKVHVCKSSINQLPISVQSW